MSNHLEPQEKISARRTYTLLQQAFFKLLTEKPFEKITLKELCDTAMIPRSTFYRYFEDQLPPGPSPGHKDRCRNNRAL